MSKDKTTPVRFNKSWITLPYHVVGTEEWDLAGTLKALSKAVKAQ